MYMIQVHDTILTQPGAHQNPCVVVEVVPTATVASWLFQWLQLAGPGDTQPFLGA